MAKDYVVQPYYRSDVDLKIDYKKKLNPQQWAAVACPPGPALVIAGAGTGKTRTVTHRAAYLIEHGIKPDRILLLTFTNKAAKEMMHQVASLLEQELIFLWGGTFHSIGNRILRRHLPAIQYPRDFTIMDSEDAKDLLSACIAEEKIDVKAERFFPKPEVLANIFSQAVNRMIPLAEMIEAQFDHFERLTSQIEAVYKRYLTRKRSGGLMDFDDLLALWLELLKKDEGIRREYQQRFHHILVDEYQDTNKLQSSLIDLLAEGHGNVMVVGDDSQSIYSWRGADFTNILEFSKRHPKARTFKIETNYRSTPEILDLANSAIAANVNQFKKELQAVRGAGPKPVLVSCNDANEQAAFVTQRALELREEGRKLDDLAILYRAHSHAMEIQLELTRRNIPFVVTSGIPFFAQAHIKDVTAYLRLVTNPRNELAFKRLVKLLPGIGAKAADKLWGKFFEQLTEPQEIPSEGAAEERNAAEVAACLAGCAKAVPRKAKAAWAQLSGTVAQIKGPLTGGSLGKIIELVLEAGYEDYLKERYDNYRSRLEEVQQLAHYARQFESAEEFLAQLALETNLDVEDRAPDTDDDERIRLTSIHQAKGLEFGVVFLVMLCDGLFPSSRSLPDAEEEERRLFYVATTRAKDELYLSYPLMRFTQGRQGDVRHQPSRFLRELPDKVYEEWRLTPPSS
ncbi:MAG: ATP-dependent DNA helicase PcrA [Verrucomicrobia subdivision 3 bacterium]|nr:ATP-dependent DNA helicase PcrA [Limisphaerales bacterium]MCS1417853.1 ATP-dependent DNA helicase PcrA [Limisphaerales bacterium]